MRHQGIERRNQGNEDQYHNKVENNYLCRRGGATEKRCEDHRKDNHIDDGDRRNYYDIREDT